MLPFRIRFYLDKYKPRRLFKQLTPRRILLICAVLLLTIVTVIVVRSGNKPSPAHTSVADAEEIVIGIALPSAFAGQQEDGRIIGYERDIAEAVLHELYPEKPLTFIPITSQEASFLLRSGQIDIALGMYVSGPLKAQGLSLSNAYFTDGVYAFCSAENPVNDLWVLANQRVRVLSSDITKSAVASMFKELEIPVDLHLCSSYPDGLEAVLTGDCVALIGPRYKLESFSELHRIEEPVGFASYRFLLWPDNKDLTELINDTLADLRARGTLADLQHTWGLEEYQ